MGKPRIIIADKDINYIFPLQLKFVEDFFDKIDLEIISDHAYLSELFSTPQCADILIISHDMYDTSMQRHNIANIFVMSEQQEEEHTAELAINYIFKYTSIKEIFNEIIGKSSDVFDLKKQGTQETQVVIFYSSCGGVGKTTLAMGVSASLVKNHKKVLYINAAHLQHFQHLLRNQSPISTSDVYAKLSSPTEQIYADTKHIVRTELFSYIPPFKAALMSLGLRYTIYEKMIMSAKKSEEYDYIIVDTDVTFDEDKASLLNIADRVFIITGQSHASVFATNMLTSNINGINSGKYVFLCNNFNNEEYNALISSDIPLKFTISDYVEHFQNYEIMKTDNLSRESSIQRIAFLII